MVRTSDPQVLAMAPEDLSVARLALQDSLMPKLATPCLTPTLTRQSKMPQPMATQPWLASPTTVQAETPTSESSLAKDACAGIGILWISERKREACRRLWFRCLPALLSRPFDTAECEVSLSRGVTNSRIAFYSTDQACFTAVYLLGVLRVIRYYGLHQMTETVH